MVPEPGVPDPRVKQYGDLLDEVSVFSTSLAGFDEVGHGLDVSAWLRQNPTQRGQSLVGRLVNAYAELASDETFFADRGLFEPRANPDRVAQLDNSIWAITTALLGGERVGQFDVDVALRLAFGGDPVSQLFGAALSGRLKTVFPEGGGFPNLPDIPDDDRIPFEKLDQLGCYVGLHDALQGVALAAAAIGRTKPYPGMTIAGLDPSTGCPGDVIRVLGKGFGTTQPPDAIVVFGSIRAEVVPGKWKDDEFSVVVPDHASECCVSVLQVPPGTTGAGDTLAEATSDLAGVVTDCFGLVGMSVGIKLGQLANHAPDSEAAVCAPDGSNKFIGGRPRITILQTNAGSASPQKMRPGEPLELEWSIANARSAAITITPRAGTSPLAVTPSFPSWFAANPIGGRAVLATTPGLVPWTVLVTLRATNACGSVSQSLEISWDPAPAFVFVGGGWRSSFDLGATEALALLVPAGPSVCAGSGLGALSAACVAADFPNPASLKAFWDSSHVSEDWYGPNPALANPGDFAAVNNAEWQTRARAEVLTMDALGLLRAFMVPYKPADDRKEEWLISVVAGYSADKAFDALDDAVAAALEEAGQTALSSVPIVAIVWAAAKWGISAFNDFLKGQTANLLGSLPAMFDDSGLRTLIATATTGIDQRLRTSGRKVRIPLASLEKGRALYGLEGAALSEAPAGSQIRANTAMASLVQASATVPLLSAPRPLAGDSYVDGALRDPVPIGAAIEAGAGSVVVIQPHVRLMAERPTFGAAGLPQIDARVSLMRDTQSLDGAVDVFARFARDPVTKISVGRWRVPLYVIEPTVDLIGLGAAVGQSGLANIMSDYGYMRAYDAVVPWLLLPKDGQRADRDQMIAQLTLSSDKIVGLRVKAWEQEHQLNGWAVGPFGPTTRTGLIVGRPQQSMIPEIRTTKTEIRAAIVDRLAVPGRFETRAAPAVPPGSITTPPVPRPRAERWVQGWEKYDFSQAVAPATVTPAMPNGDPWVSLTWANQWTEPAGTRPALIWP